MIQGGDDSNGNGTGAQQQPRLQLSSLPQAQGQQQEQIQVQQALATEPQSVLSSGVTLGPSIQTQRITLTQAVPSTVNVIASPVTAAATAGAAAPSSSGASFQHYLIPGVSLGGQIQNIAIPAQVAVSVQQGTVRAAVTTAQGLSTASPYAINSPQGLARILAAASQGYTVRANSRPTVAATSAPSQPTAVAQLQTTVPAVAAGINVQNVHLQKVVTTAPTVLTVPVTSTVTMAQRSVGTARQEGVAVRITTSSAATLLSQQQQQPAIVLDVTSGLQAHHGDVTRVHSYSLASASSVTSVSGATKGSPLLHMTAESTSRVTPSLIQSMAGPSEKLVLPNMNSGSQTILQKQTVSGASLVGVPVNTNTAATIPSPVSSCGNSESVVNPTQSPIPSELSNPSPLTSPKPKRKKLEEKPPPDEAVASARKKICDHHLQELKMNKENYIETLTELFFLQNGGNMMDYLVWKKRSTSQLVAYLRANALDSDDEEEQRLPSERKNQAAASSHTSNASVSSEASQVQGGKPLGNQVPNLLKTASSHTVSSLLKTSTPPTSHSTPVSRSQSVSSANTPGVITSPIARTPKSSPLISLSTNRLPTRQHSISAVYDSSIGSQEEIVERAKQEAYAMQRIAELRKEGLWSSKRLPKVQEPPRTKAHWDYLLEEMVWLATDFAQERKWKKAAAKKCGRMVMKYHQERDQKAERAEKEEQLKLRKIASLIAKEIKQFWTNIEKLVEYVQQTRLEEKRKKALDLHLNFIVDQTEKYSSWLTQGMNKSFTESLEASKPSSIHGSRESSPELSTSDVRNDGEFEPGKSESDDEETIEQEEAEGINEEERKAEVELLHKESEVPLEELLHSLPEDILERPAKPYESSSDSSSEENVDGRREDSGNEQKESKNKQRFRHRSDRVNEDDDEFHLSSEEELPDDEETMEEQERIDVHVDHQAELKDLEDEGNLSLEELYNKYEGAYASDFDMPDSDESSAISEEEEERAGVKSEGDEASGEESEEDEIASEEEMDIDVGMEYTVLPEKDELKEIKVEGDSSKDTGPSKEITDIAAAAESFQPKGNTLSTTQVCTKVPFLLKHQLREYQHIGLDWLVAMQDRKLNGILADEMGLGKTIQTIALLAHLACENGIWGPHLIVVPTSVMLNWEMEFKKWCPAFKILTYYGSPKERRQKRQGWTKPNTFHICITSYKLVIQDHQSFRRKRWKYFILDEAQHIKNFKSQRWQMLLNFQSSRRLLLTGTPLQNSLMELWSLMHFLMPNVFQSHREFREWFANPVTGMIEGSHDYNENLIKRLHKVLRPFLLRRLKCEVEKQLPKKYEHVVMCRLSKRQRYLYDDFMAQAKTKETLAAGNFMSVINILMQLRKVCNHPNMFEPRPIISPFMMEGITFHVPSLVWQALDYNPLRHISLWALNFLLVDLELCLTAFAAHRIKKFQMPPRIIEEIDSQPQPPPRCPPGKIRLHIRTSTSANQSPAAVSPHQQYSCQAPILRTAVPAIPRTLVQSQVASQQRIVVVSGPSSAPSSRAASPVACLAGGQPVTQPHAAEYTLQLVQKQAAGGVSMAQLTPLNLGSQIVTSAPITVQIQPAGQGTTRLTMPLGIGRLVQTSTGQHLLLTPASSMSSEGTVGQQPSSPAMVLTGLGAASVVQAPCVGAATVLPQVSRVGVTVASGATTSTATPVANIQSSTPSTSVAALAQSSKPVVRVAPMNIAQLTAAGVSGVPASSSKASIVHTPSKPVTRADTHLLAQPSTSKSVGTKSVFYLESMVSKKRQLRRSRLEQLGRTNTFRCAACPIYGRDLIEAVMVTSDIQPCHKGRVWGGMGYIHCLNAPFSNSRPREYWLYSYTLNSMVPTPETVLHELHDIIYRYVFVVPVVTAPVIQMHMSHPPPSKLHQSLVQEQILHKTLSPACSILHPIWNRMRTHFPELRLIQYDCGKLQTLDKLLWRLKSGSHRVLIFTQMTRMLDILEQFLNYHGHTYLRLDGTTRVDQRQALMERFNADKRIFCFILSTRSGGIGVNLTGADTVIFYDGDWNPTMDAQAQDRCHRIGQTRDVHIYRLISERTVEENILKKANQKRLLGDLAIEGGNFTTAFFKKSSIQELFGINLPEEFHEIKKEEDAVDEAKNSDSSEKVFQTQYEQALCMAEEELDIEAERTARAEALAELAEFDESIPIDADSRDNEEKSQAEEELEKLVEQLTPVERYAMQFLESQQESFSLEQLKQAEEEIEAQKKDWELGRLKAIKEEEERRAVTLEDDEEPMLTYCREDAYNQVAKSNKSASRSKIRRSRGGDGITTNSLDSSVSQRRSSRIISKQTKKSRGDDSDSDAWDSRDHRTVLNHIANKVSRSGDQSRKPLNHVCVNSFGRDGKGKVMVDGESPVAGSSLRIPISGAKSASERDLVSSPTPQPFSNPNLVIRTRRASAMEAEVSKPKQDSDLEIDVVTVNPKDTPFLLTRGLLNRPSLPLAKNLHISHDRVGRKVKSVMPSKEKFEEALEERNGV